MSRSPFTVIIAHGWSWQSQWLLPLIQAIETKIQGQHTAQFYGLEQHYFSTQPAELLQYTNGEFNPTTLNLTEIANNTQPISQLIGIGHSFGLSHLLQMPVKWNGLISLHGFVRFVADANNPHGTPSRMITSMIQKFQIDPKPVLNDFWNRCELPSPTVPDTYSKTLTDHLEQLSTLNVAPQLYAHLSNQIPFITVSSVSDRIVHSELTHLGQSIPYTLRTPHAGPSTHPALYTECILSLFNFLSPPNE